MMILVMGVSGSGKTTVGKMLAARLDAEFLDADDLHPPQNISKMSDGLALTDDDRLPWLEAVRDRALDLMRSGRDVVVSCSTLKQSYRDVFADAMPVTTIYLKGDQRLIAARLAERTAHFMPPALLQSQFEALEEPTNAITIEISTPPKTIVDQVLHAINQ